MSRTNRNFGKLNESGAIEFAPVTIREGYSWNVSPSAAHYLAAGYLPVVDERPATDSDHYAVATGYALSADGASIVRVYEVREVEKPPRRWTRRSVKTALVAAGKWDAVKQMLTAMDKYEDFLMCNYIEEGNKDFVAAYNAAVSAYGKEAVDAIIDTIPTEV